MQFNSTVFIFFFLPVVVLVHVLLHRNNLRNVWLFLASVLFFCWCSESNFFFVILYAIVNYALVQFIANKPKQKFRLVVGVCFDVAVLFVFKYLNFAISISNRFLGSEFAVLELFQPVGISFVTFTAIAYIVDIYRGNAISLKNPIEFFLYLFLFPKVAQGPIVRFSNLQNELKNRTCSTDEFVGGVKRFVIGLAKKCLIADVLGKSVDLVFDSLNNGIAIDTAWIGILFYMFQIYYDFSGYTDMAIGVGKMLGFTLPENFDAPYRSKSVSEFWNRWHMTLGRWFKDYIYIPLGGNRKGNIRTILNLAVVWLVTGIWHGAAFNYILWGMYYGAIIIFEKQINKRSWYLKIPVGIKWACTFICVMFGWVLFRASSVEQIVLYFKTMFGMREMVGFYTSAYFFDLPGVLALIAGVLISLPKPKFLASLSDRSLIVHFIENIGIALLFLISVLFMVNSTYNAFIYFQF